jgi:hypothetical protein
MSAAYGFELIQEREIKELNTHARLYRHVKSGAQLLSLENQDENKVFGITFRTPPADSTGIAHIMEHSVLCGSDKYPLKDPFVELVKGSLKTFINAFTFPDKTCYPVASQNIKDLYNLVDVYMDAVFHPLILPTTLQQEGWHFELDSLEAPLEYKGVVFNEMKGAYSNPDDVLQDKARMSLLPDTPYGVDSGGDPRHIPDLTYAQFKRFHEKYYHPSNARIFFYGDDDPVQRLQRMDQYLSPYERLQIDSSVPLQSRFETPRRAEVSYDPGDEDESMKGMLVMNWLLTETDDPVNILGLYILSHILVGTVASPLRKSLIDSGLGEDMVGVGLDGELRQVYFSAGLKGIKADTDGELPAAGQIEDLILQTLEGLARDGIDPEMVAAALNTVEFRLRENNTGSFPQGLMLMLNALTTWLYEGDPMEPLAFETPLSAIKDQLKAGAPYFEEMIRRYLLANQHRTTVVLRPQPGLQAQRDQEEKERLASAKAAMSEAALKEILDQTANLKEIQQRPDPPELLAKIPVLALADLEKKVKTIPLEIVELGGGKVLYHDLFTNGILYFDLGFDLHSLPQELLPYVPLYGRALLEMGTQREDYVRLSQHIGRSTGGISSATFTSLIRGSEHGAARLYLRSKSTRSQASELLNILEDILLTVRLDNKERFRQIVLEDKAGTEAGLTPAGHRVVNSRLRAQFNEADWASEQMNGVSQLFFLRGLVNEIDGDWPSVQERLEKLRGILLNQRTMIFNVTLDGGNWSSLRPELQAFIEKIPSYAPVFTTWKPGPATKFEGLAIPAPVNYVGKGANLFDLGYQADGSIEVIINYLRTTWIWDRVRIQGGAYGGFCLFNHRTGVFTFLSYRDPNLLQTLDNYDQTAAFLRNLELERDEMVKSIIGSIGDMDAYLLPDARGYVSMNRYMTGETDDVRQTWRDQLLDTNLADFRALGEHLQQLNDTASVVVLGSPEALAKANAEKDGWLEIRKVM